MTAAVMRWALNCLELQKTTVIATVIDTSGSVPGKTGARIAMSDLGENWVGTVGGAGLELKVLNRCRELIKTFSKPYGEIQTFGLSKSAKGYEVQPLDSLCGGRVTLSIEVMIPMPHILLIGGGHCALALSKSIDLLGWKYSVHDTRKDFCNSDLYSTAENLYPSSTSEFLSKMDKDLTKYSDILLLGHDWSEDQERLIRILQKITKSSHEEKSFSVPRVGVIGSRSKWQKFEKKGLEIGIEKEILDSVICPIGLNVGAESPEEIAVAVLAQILSFYKQVEPSEPNWREKI